MTITADSLYSWRMPLWLLTGTAIVVAMWRLTAHVKVIWQRTFLRAGAIALCFTLLPAPEMFGESAYLMMIPLWSALLWSVTNGSVSGFAVTLIPWLIVTYLLWVVGMSIHHFVRWRQNKWA